jgi:hypothetical protein
MDDFCHTTIVHKNKKHYKLLYSKSKTEYQVTIRRTHNFLTYYYHFIIHTQTTKTVLTLTQLLIKNEFMRQPI